MTRASALLVALGALALGTVAVPAQAQPQESGDRVSVTRLDPSRLARGADVALAHLDGRTIVDGDRRIVVRTGTRLYVEWVGRSGHAYIVSLIDRFGERPNRLVRVRRDGTRRLLRRGYDAYQPAISADGNLLTSTQPARRGDTRLRVFSAHTGKVVRVRTFTGYVDVLDTDAGRMVLGGAYPARTSLWNIRTNHARRLVGRTGYVASIAADRLATHGGEPFEEGCTVVTKLGAPQGPRVWRSCRESVRSFSPSGARMLTARGYVTGTPDTSRLHLRTGHGRLLARYSADAFGADLRWESGHTLLVDTTTGTRYAVVRCVRADCERATKVVSVEG